MSIVRPISRRTLLKGLGTAIALPYLEAMLPQSAMAAPASVWPTRAAFFFVPNGVHLPYWTPSTEGSDFELPSILQPLANVRDRMNIFTGLTLDAGKAHGDGPGDHARAAATFLTGVHPYKTAGPGIKVGVSVDQVAAKSIGSSTRFASLELGLERGLNAGGCDSGYSCAYSSNISWRTESTPSAKETDPKLVFDRLFGSDSKEESESARQKRRLYNKSVLDFVMEDARSLERRLGHADQQKLDEYLSSLREVETRVKHFTAEASMPAPDLEIPEEMPKDMTTHLRLMGDLTVLALQSDSTRVLTLMFGNAGSNRSYKFIEVPEGHHSLSHHQNDPEKQEKIAKINTYHTTQLAYILERMQAVQEGDATLLDHSLVLYGSGLGDGNRHNHDNLPILTFGRANGAAQTGLHRSFPKDTPLCNLYLSMLHTLGVREKSFGDSTGILEGFIA